MYCNKCGKQVRETNKFCRYCGNRLVASPEGTGTSFVPPSNPAQTGQIEKKAVTLDNNKMIAIVVGCIVLVVIAVTIIYNYQQRGSYDDDYYEGYDDSYNEDYDNYGYEDQFNTSYFEEYSDDFYLPYSASEYYSIDELEDMYLDEEQTQWAINEIYARRGRDFQDEPYSSYFYSCEWYYPTYSADEFDENIFNKYERKNIKTLVQYAEDNGWR